MRIVAGKHRGRRLVAPDGRAIRPTSDRAREALFDLLTHSPVLRRHRGPSSGHIGSLLDIRILDAFAGTGALGLEALSRGAGHVIFMDRERAALECLSRNLRALEEDDRATVLRADATRPPKADQPVDLALLDPPYGSGLAAAAVGALAAAGWIAAATMCVVELSHREEFVPPATFTAGEERRYGKTRFVFLTRGASENSE